MRYLSVCSGIEAATVAWHHMGWEPAAFADIEAFPSAVLAHHYPSVPNLGDMTKFKEWDIGAIDLLVGGTPCQSFSVAGLRKGLEDPRGNLALTYCAILDKFKPKWFVWENVPGVLSSNGGRDFGAFLGAVAELGYGFAYRVCDAQWFGVPQRRRRVFVVGCLGDWRSAAEVLFEPESLRWDLAPSREKGQKVAPTVVQGPPYSRTGNERVECDAIVLGNVEGGNATTLSAREYKGLSCGRDGMTSAAVVYEAQTTVYESPSAS
jgi:DNA (cytosine-5)-methyltransferase 1